MEFDPDVLAYYDRGEEQGRLTERPSLERARTQVLLERLLPLAPARVLDVGGGAGVYASWLADEGYQVHLVDPVPLHVEQARTGGEVTAAVGDARHLEEADDSWDAVLMLGPLYHLTARAERIRATAYFHHPDDLAAEMAEAGLGPGSVLPVEGVLHWVPDIEARLLDPGQRRLILDFLAAAEGDAAVSAATAHLLAVGTA